MVDSVAEIVLEVRPNILTTHPPFSIGGKRQADLLHHDHLEIGIAVNKAVAIAATPNPKSKHNPHQVAATCYVGIEFAPFDVAPQRTNE